MSFNNSLNASSTYVCVLAGLPYKFTVKSVDELKLPVLYV